MNLRSRIESKMRKLLGIVCALALGTAACGGSGESARRVAQLLLPKSGLIGCDRVLAPDAKFESRIPSWRTIAPSKGMARLSGTRSRPRSG
jgi:hypothetical protein